MKKINYIAYPVTTSMSSIIDHSTSRALFVSVFKRANHDVPPPPQSQIAGERSSSHGINHQGAIIKRLLLSPFSALLHADFEFLFRDHPAGIKRNQLARQVLVDRERIAFQWKSSWAGMVQIMERDKGARGESEFRVGGRYYV